ncbi:hypothetical protein G7046_g5820 [Stylonectria norvegica]|nr:hypothetical protein G7046_g5820 [Stylonectria norvegica]
MSTSIFGSVKNKLSRKLGSKSERGSRIDSMSNSNGSSWNTTNNTNPFRDFTEQKPSGKPYKASLQTDMPSLLTKSPANDAPPAYSASPLTTESGPSSLNPNGPSTRRGVSPVPSIASVTTAEDKYAFLSTFDTVFVIDDSGSMAGRSWREVRDALRAITPICTSHDADGIDVFFLNHTSSSSSGGYANIRDAAQVQRLFDSVSPRGATPTGSRLHSILKPYVASLARKPDAMESIKPVNIIVITDGCPTDDPESIIVQHAKKLDKLEAPPYQVGIQFFQVGSEPGATRALRELDDDLADQGIRDIVDTVTWDAAGASRGCDLTADSILKVVLGAVVRRLDRKATSGESSGLLSRR